MFFLGSQCLIKHHNSLTWQLWLRYGFYVGTVHGAAVLQAGGSDAQGGVVLPGLQGAGQGDLLDHLSRRHLLAGVQHLVRVGQDQLKREVAGVALGVQQRDLRVRSSGDKALSFNNSIFDAVTKAFGTNRHCFIL